MKQKSTFPYAIALMAVLFFSCSKDKDGSKSEAPIVNPSSSFTINVDGKIYHMKVDGMTVQKGDTAQVILSASSPEVSVRINAKSPLHTAGVGDYFLWCCRNDVFERLTSGAKKHWETDHAGDNRQVGFVKISKMDEKGFEGTYLLDTKDGTQSTAARKEYTGTFNIIY